MFAGGNAETVGVGVEGTDAGKADGELAGAREEKAGAELLLSKEGTELASDAREFVIVGVLGSSACASSGTWASLDGAWLVTLCGRWLLFWFESRDARSAGSESSWSVSWASAIAQAVLIQDTSMPIISGRVHETRCYSETAGRRGARTRKGRGIVIYVFLCDDAGAR